MTRRTATILALLPLAAGIGGCEAKNLVYVQDTVLGIDASVSMEGPQKLQLGFARDTFALVPKRREESGKGEAMSVAAFSLYTYTFLAEFSFNQFIATGKAASQLATNADTMTLLERRTYQSSLADIVEEQGR
jgi:hypothetical protein